MWYILLVTHVPFDDSSIELNFKWIHWFWNYWARNRMLKQSTFYSKNIANVILGVCQVKWKVDYKFSYLNWRRCILRHIGINLYWLLIAGLNMLIKVFALSSFFFQFVKMRRAFGVFKCHYHFDFDEINALNTQMFIDANRKDINGMTYATFNLLFPLHRSMWLWKW